MKKVFSKIIIFATITLLLAACGSGQDQSEKSGSTNENAGEKKVITMGTSADFPPFESRTPEGEFEGFDIDLAHAIAEKLGAELKIEDMKFDGLIGALQTNRLDMVLAGMNSTEERKKNVDFSIEYLEASSTFVTKEEDKAISSLEDLTGKIVGVQLGSIQAEGAKELSEEYDFEVKIVDNANIIVQELLSNKVDVAYLDKEVAVGFEKEQNLVGWDDPTGAAPGYAVALPKDSELLDDVNKALEELIAEGKIEELKEKWGFGE